MIVTGLDLETTGLDPADGHRIIEVAMISYDLARRVETDRFVQRIDPDRNIPAASQAIHGITYEELVGCPKWDDVAPEVEKRLASSGLLIAHNAAFDGPFVAAELTRAKRLVPKIECFCTMETSRWATPNGKLPRLDELCFALGVEYDPGKAHAADYDVEVMMQCFLKGYDRGVYVIPAVAMRKAA